MTEHLPAADVPELRLLQENAAQMCSALTGVPPGRSLVTDESVVEPVKAGGASVSLSLARAIQKGWSDSLNFPAHTFLFLDVCSINRLEQHASVYSIKSVLAGESQ